MRRTDIYFKTQLHKQPVVVFAESQEYDLFARPLIRTHRDVNNRLAMEDEGCTDHMDVLIVGPGILGSLFAVKWKEKFPQAVVSALSRSSKSHARLQALGVQPFSIQKPREILTPL